MTLAESDRVKIVEQYKNGEFFTMSIELSTDWPFIPHPILKRTRAYEEYSRLLQQG